MNTIEIKNLDSKSIFKVMLYMLVLPAIVISILSIAFFLKGTICKDDITKYIGVALFFSYVLILFPLFLLLSVFGTKIYNFFSNKFGGLKIDIINIHNYAEVKK